MEKSLTLMEVFTCARGLLDGCDPGRNPEYERALTELVERLATDYLDATEATVDLRKGSLTLHFEGLTLHSEVKP